MFASGVARSRACWQRRVREHVASDDDHCTVVAEVEWGAKGAGADAWVCGDQVMGAVIKAHKGEVDNIIAKRIAEQLLAAK